MSVFAPLVSAVLVAVSAAGQSLDSLKLDHLAARAKDHTELTLDASTLLTAGRQLTGGGDEAKAKSLISGLRGVAIRSYEFEREGEYSPADVDQMRRLFQAPGWTRVIDISSKADRESFEVFTRTEAGKPAAMGMVAAEPRELTLIYIDGAVDIGRLSELGSRFGIPGAKKKGSK